MSLIFMSAVWSSFHVNLIIRIDSSAQRRLPNGKQTQWDFNLNLNFHGAKFQEHEKEELGPNNEFIQLKGTLIPIGKGDKLAYTQLVRLSFGDYLAGQVH